MYSLLKPILFKLDPEFTHKLALISLQISRLLHIKPRQKYFRPTTIFNLTFPNPIGLAAGFDKNGDYIEALDSLGFGFIEIGTLTPKPQSGNAKPRLFRLPEQKAVINRMGFNNKGIEYAAKRLSQTTFTGILGINIGKNRDTPNDKASDDYLHCMRLLWPYASYFVINISSPNTPGLRDLQHESVLHDLLLSLKNEQKKMVDTHKKYIPLLVKISPDLSDVDIQTLGKTLLEVQIDGVIATNTSVQRFGLDTPVSKEIGGLSGAPLEALSTHVIRILYSILGEKIPIIASGGVMDEKSAKEKLAAGAKLLQLYTGLVYEGPGLIQKLSSTFAYS